MAESTSNNRLKLTPKFSAMQSRSYSGSAGDYLDAGHMESLALTSGTLSLSFSLDRLPGSMALVSKDGEGRGDGGGFTVWVLDGTLVVTHESAAETEYLKVPDLVLSANQTYHFALSFGSDGLAIWLNGEMVAAEPEFMEGIALNHHPLVVGASRAYSQSDTDPAHSLFKGSIGDVMVFDRQLGEANMIALAGAVDPALGAAADMQAEMADLMPVLGQMDQASDTLVEILDGYGITADGQFGPLTMMHRGGADNRMKGGSDAEGINGGGGDDVIRAGGGSDMVQGGYGNDRLMGGAGNDILDGGAGEDRLWGGAGNDLLISRADAREPEIHFDAARDEGDPMGELTDGKLYADQPVPGDDMLVGGRGADIFYFQTLINAKERFIREHTGDDGVINWQGVAGENYALHDHWVDYLGNDVVMDYSRNEGDRLVIEGHTTQIASITYGDANGDGVMDFSLISLYSDQGANGGAHNGDRLGTIKVYGDLVRLSDIEHTSRPAYGIITGIGDLKEALSPTDIAKDSGPIEAPKSGLPSIADLGLPEHLKPVFALAGQAVLTGKTGDYLDAGHIEGLALTSGTLSLSFSLDRLPGSMALVSKDGEGRGDGGGFTVWVLDGTLVVTHESAAETEYLKVPDLVLSANQTYHFALSFGSDGLAIWLNGEMVAAEPEFMEGIALNHHPLVVGASRAYSQSDTDPAHSLFKGSIGDVMVFDRQLGEANMIALAGAVDPALGAAADMQAEMADLMPVLGQMDQASDTLVEILDGYGITADGQFGPLTMMHRGGADNRMKGGSDAEGINGGGGDDVIRAGGGSDMVQGGYGNDRLMGGAGNDILDGGAGEDRLWGGAGNDLLISRADAREPEIHFDAARDEGDPMGELTDGKLYADQPVPGDDMLVGGRGADIFYFQTLINAKERFIREHTGDDGVINWQGVAGENYALHDHWVDYLGNDVVMDYSRNEGDRLVIEGHTTQIASITYGDANGDGVMDFSLISLYSDQGANGGAHNGDRLGTIKVYGDLVRLSDIEHTSRPAYGIITGIGDLKEALSPTDIAKDSGPIEAPKSGLPSIADLGLPGNLKPVFAAAGSHDFNPDDQAALVFGHNTDLALTAGTIAFSFCANTVTRFQALMSKDATDYGNGGHITAYLTDSGGLVVRIQSTDTSHYFEVDNAIKAGRDYDFALSFGAGGAELYLNGARVAVDSEITVNLAENTEALMFGATGWSSTQGTTDSIHSYFDGTISNIMAFDTELTGEDIFGTALRSDHAYFDGLAENYVYARTMDGSVMISDDSGSTVLPESKDFVAFSNMTIRKNDIQFGANGEDSLSGSDGSDVLSGKAGNDILNGYRSDDLLFGGNGDDQLFGGSGSDYLFGQAGDDKLFGGDGADRIEGGDGHDDLFGGNGNDLFFGGLGDDDIFGHSWDDAGDWGNDRVVFDGNFADYSFETTSWYDSNRGETITVLTVTDAADGGLDGYYEGRDRLIDIDVLVFADQSATFDSLL